MRPPPPRATLFPYTTLFRSQAEREQEHERTVSRDQGTQRTHEKLYQSSHERGNGERSHDSQSIESNSIEIGQSHEDRKSTRLNSSHVAISYAVCCLKKKRTH